ncbi:MAG TPA: GlsB/YeaQ/YmgE family stress response membrane protein [Corynebacterium sp.]|nr:GlsB/YeaQ/YmgE family stress response membrane protein [Corynebacterium sp.]
MSIIGWIIIGAIAGFLAEKIMKRDHGLLTNIVVGIVGGVVGGWLLSLVGLGSGGWLWTLFTAVLGACLLLWVVGAIRSKSSN